MCFTSLVACAPAVIAQTNVTPAQYLANQPKPHFKSGHHLPHLSKWSWPFPFDLRVELATNWGFALEFNGVRDLEDMALDMADTNSTPFKCLQLARAYPDKYKLAVSIDRFFSSSRLHRISIPDGMWVTNSEGLFVDGKSNIWADASNTVYTKVVSPEAPTAAWQQVAKWTAEPLSWLVASNAPVAIVLNGGEYGLGAVGMEGKAWTFDPRIIDKTNGMSSWTDYASKRKSVELGYISTAVRKAVPNRELLVYYDTNNETHRWTSLGDWFNTWNLWGFWSRAIHTNSDLPALECYYINTWETPAGSYQADLLTKYLNGVGYQQTLGLETNYSWVCGGWGTNAARLSEIPRYMGFLKCLYTGGMVGGVAGYFDYPLGGFDVEFPANSPPHWLQQIQALAHVHALFSHVETFLRNGDLLPGPTNHVMATDQPAYEFPTGDSTARVLARKLHASDQWLITAWAQAGADRTVTVTIPSLGQVSVQARASGSVYRSGISNAAPQLTLLDEDGLLPTASLLGPTKLRVLAVGN